MNPCIDDSEVEVWDWEGTSQDATMSIAKAHKYHPDYGFPDEIRRDVLSLASETNVKLAAAYYGVSVASVYKWKREMSQ